jgi:hypothetical protein
MEVPQVASAFIVPERVKYLEFHLSGAQIMNLQKTALE